MDVNNVKSQMRKGMLEYCIMLLLHKEPAYASDIIQKLKEARLIVVEGTLYPLLTRLKNDDLLGYEWIESTQGPPRKYYRLTEKGEVFLGELETSWKGRKVPVAYDAYGFRDQLISDILPSAFSCPLCIRRV